MIINPIPGSTRANNGSYSADSGVDILCPVGTPVIACAAGRIIYSEHGHTPWVPTPGHPDDTPNSILLLLDEPFIAGRMRIRYAWYTHLSHLEWPIPDGGPTLHVVGGQLLGHTGAGNSVPHLHFGLLSDRAQGPDQTLLPRMVADLIWPPGVADWQEHQELLSSPRPEHRAKIFLNAGQARAFRDRVEVAALDVRVSRETTGALHVFVGGREVRAKSVTLEVSYE